MTLYKNWICNYKPYRVPIKLADYKIIYSEGVGSVLFRPIKMETHIEMLNLLEFYIYLLCIIIFFLCYI